MGIRVIKEVAVIPLPTTTDHSIKRGFFVKAVAGAPVLCTATTDVPLGVILDGEAAGGMDSVAIGGGNVGSVRVKTSGNVAAFTRGKLAADGSVVAAGASGARVEVCLFLEDGASGELVEAILILPTVYAS